ncbi:hypothetical protein D9758_005332 [Tetrapyrgos nigripes]|uniref:Uncharacterized protein n=1 Tax=Tetrapyrgos nigripes TaxID=182062 RepID=A0A8H5GI40_9AGAR|nr:hypothetical protein D9758_005332 [Tetrapyrgos nigripes]
MLAIVTLVLAAFASATPVAPTCKPGFVSGSYNVLLSDNPSLGWQYSSSPAQVELVPLAITNLTEPAVTWAVWPPNGSSPDWTFSSAQFPLLDSCALAPSSDAQELTHPTALTTGKCIDPATGYGSNQSIFSIECDTCASDFSANHGCVLTMPEVDSLCPVAGFKNLVSLVHCGDSHTRPRTGYKWDIILVP